MIGTVMEFGTCGEPYGQSDVKRVSEYVQVNGNVKRQAAPSTKASTQATSSKQCSWS